MSYMSHNFDKKRHSKYVPQNTDKYVGGDYPICRSSWERDFCQWCDNSPFILKWGSENLHINYPHPFYRTPQGLPQSRRYFPDFTLVIQNKQGQIQKWIVEVKPYKETHPPRNKGKKSRKTLIEEQKRWKINSAKWKSALVYCKRINAKFKLITERELYGSKGYK